MSSPRHPQSFFSSPPPRPTPFASTGSSTSSPSTLASLATAASRRELFASTRRSESDSVFQSQTTDWGELPTELGGIRGLGLDLPSPTIGAANLLLTLPNTCGGVVSPLALFTTSNPSRTPPTRRGGRGGLGHGSLSSTSSPSKIKRTTPIKEHDSDGDEQEDEKMTHPSSSQSLEWNYQSTKHPKIRTAEPPSRLDLFRLKAYSLSSLVPCPECEAAMVTAASEAARMEKEMTAQEKGTKKEKVVGIKSAEKRRGFFARSSKQTSSAPERYAYTRSTTKDESGSSGLGSLMPSFSSATLSSTLTIRSGVGFTHNVTSMM